MLATLTDIWKAIPGWGKATIEVVAVLTAYVVLKILYRQEEWRRRIEAWLWLAALLCVNWLWGVPGLLILIAFAGGLTAWHLAIRADAAESRRTRRLLETMEEYLYARYLRHCELYPETTSALAEDPFRDWMKKEYEVVSPLQLLDEWDEKGVTVEDLYRRMDAEKSAHAKRLAEAKKE
jgi:hypothetical protein